MSWNNPPSFEVVSEAMRELTEAKARQRVAKYELAEIEAAMDKVKPRTPWVRVLGVDEDSAKIIKQRRLALLEAENAVDRCQAHVDFLEYAKDMYKALAYRERF